MNWKRLLGNVGGALLAGFLTGQVTNGVVKEGDSKALETAIVAGASVAVGLFQKRPHKDDE